MSAARSAALVQQGARRVPAGETGATARERGMVKAVGRVMREQLATRSSETLALIEALAQRIEALESSGTKSLADAYRGTYLAGTTYERGQMITHSGSLWLCMADTQSVPGDGVHWKLVVKGAR